MQHPEINDHLIADVEQAGLDAYRNGGPRAPISHPLVYGWIEKHDPVIGAAAPLYRAYSRGWNAGINEKLRAAGLPEEVMA